MGGQAGAARVPADQMQGGLVSAQQASEPAIRASEELVEDAPGHRRRSARVARHEARIRLKTLVGDEERLEDADLLCPQVPHDLGRKASKPPKEEPKPGRRPGFKVWKTPFWKRRRRLWAERNAAARRLVEEE